MLRREDFLIAAASALLVLGIGGALHEVLRSRPNDNEIKIYDNGEPDANDVLDTYNTSDSVISYSSMAISCLDSPWKIMVNNKKRRCQWIGSNSIESCSTSEEIRQHCPLTCNTCATTCEDLTGQFKVGGLYVTCNSIYYCANPTFANSCRVSCDICTNSTIAPTSSPSFGESPVAPNITTPLSVTTKSWVSVGNSIYGGTEDNSGFAVCLSNDGETAFVGQPGSGLVRSFTPDVEALIPKGLAIGNAYDPWFGSSVVSSHDGSVVAISSYKYDNYRGLVRVFIWDGIKWIKLGDDLLGDEDGQWFGWDVDISGDGKSIIVGVYLENSSPGYASVFDIDSSGWKKRGKDLVGDDVGDFGFSVAISANGNAVAIGAPKGSYAEVYEWTSNTWSILGDRINGSTGANFGNRITLSCKSGLVLAIGANHENNGEGAVFVYEWKAIASEWQLRGNDAAVYGKNTIDFLGGRISSSEDGNVIAYNSRDKVGVLVWDGLVWGEQGRITTEGLTSVSLSGDGSILVVGRPHDETIDFRAGVTNIFKWQ